MAKSLKPYADLKVKVREYTDKEGAVKGVYVTVGTLFSSPHQSHMTIKLDTIPVGEWNGWISAYKREDFETDATETNDIEDIGL